MKSRQSGWLTGGAALALLVAASASAEVSLTERHVLRRRQVKAEKARHRPSAPDATGAITLDDISGLRYFINTDITFATTSSASGAMSEASYTGPVMATTSAGGVVASTLNDAFDGYNTLCIGPTGATTACATGSPDYTIYNNNGPATTECGGRQVVYPVQTIGALSVTRKVFVPANDAFGRWLNLVTNTDASPQTLSVTIANNLGSDANTVIVTSSNGNPTAELTDRWVSTFQNYSGTTSSDVRLAHVLQGPSRRAGLAAVTFADGDDNPFWSYTFTLQPGERGIIMNFVTPAPSKAAAAAKAELISHLPWTALQCMTPQEANDVLNFDAVKKGDLDNVSALAPTSTNTPGRTDLIFRNTTSNRNVAWLMDGVTRTAGIFITPDPSAADWRIAGVDDFNRDGVNDLVFNNSTTNVVEFWLMGGPNGTDRVGAAVPLTGAATLPTNWTLSATGDFNNDGNPDILWRNETSQKLVVWTMGESGALGTAKTGGIVPTPDQAVDVNWRIVGALDFNDDGCRDFLWYNTTSGKIVTWNMNCSVVRIDGAFTTPANAGDNNWQVVAGGDFSYYSPADGAPSVAQTPGTNDIIWRNLTSGRIVAWHMDTNRTRVSGQFTCPTAVGGTCNPIDPPPPGATSWVIVGPK